jgi:hypothetical protein
MAKTATYALIEAKTLGSATTSVTFSSIPITYTDLVLVITQPAATTGVNNKIQVGNSTIDTGNNYSCTQLYGNGTTAASLRISSTSGTYGGMSAPNSVSQIYFMDYSNTTTNKTWISRGSAAGDYVTAEASLWRSTVAINTIKIENNSGANYAIGATFRLYGIQAGNA